MHIIYIIIFILVYYSSPKPTLNPLRAPAVQQLFRRRLISRSRTFDNNTMAKCDFCDVKFSLGLLNAAHIISFNKSKEFNAYRINNDDDCKELVKYNKTDTDIDFLPTSVNASNNGLLLCKTCHNGFDKGKITITKEDRIQIDKGFYDSNVVDGVHTYEGIHGNLLWWLRKGEKELRNLSDFPKFFVFNYAKSENAKPKKRKRNQKSNV